MNKRKSLDSFVGESDPRPQFRNEFILKNFDREANRNPKYRGILNVVSSSWLLRGFDVELEHWETVQYDISAICRIVLDHLKEDGKYYQKLISVMPRT